MEFKFTVLDYQTRAADAVVKVFDGQPKIEACLLYTSKVLMLSATPVNNRFRDLRNQLALAYQGDPEQWSERLGLESNVEDVFRRAQGAFTRWSELPARCV